MNISEYDVVRVIAEIPAGVGPDGHTVWLADIFASELERAPSSLGGP